MTFLTKSIVVFGILNQKLLVYKLFKKLSVSCGKRRHWSAGISSSS